LHGDFEADDALAGDDGRIVVAVDVRQSAVGGDVVGTGLGGGEIVAVEDDFGVVAAATGLFDQRCEAGHDDRDRNTEPLAVKRQSQGVIARTGGDHAARSLLRRKLQERVRRAALLERAGALQVFELAENRRAAKLRKRRRLRARRGEHVLGDAALGGQDVGDGRGHRGARGKVQGLSFKAQIRLKV
jgi:hypothetical protein